MFNRARPFHSLNMFILKSCIGPVATYHLQACKCCLKMVPSPSCPGRQTILKAACPQALWQV